MRRKMMMSAIALIVLLTSVSVARGQFTKIEVFFDKVQLYVNGVSSSQDLDALIYQGTMYVPLRKVGEAMGGNVAWDSVERAVSIDFVTSMGDYVVQAADKAVYQYIAIEKNQIIAGIINQITNKNYAQIKTQLERLQELEDLSANLGDEEMRVLFNKLVFSGEVIRSGLINNTGKDLKLANDLFLDAEEDLTLHLNRKLRGLN